MNIQITKEWLRKRAERDDGAEISSGALNIEDLIKETNSLRQSPHGTMHLVSAFGKLIRFRRLEMGFSIRRLAQCAEIEPEEIESIESDAGYDAEPRIVFKLAKWLKLPDKQLMRLSGKCFGEDVGFQTQVELFAARAKNVDQLTAEEYRLLKEFVAYLAEKD